MNNITDLMTSDNMKSGVAEADRTKNDSRQSLHRRKMSSKTAPILNGSDDNNAVAADYQDSMRQQVNLAAAYHDHISCTKSADLCNKIHQEAAKESRMNLPCETDHIYANCGDKSSKQASMIHNNNSILMMTAPSKEWDAEKRQLYEMCLLQLELLKRVEEQNTAKDKTIQSIKQENETLKVRQERMERRMCLLKKMKSDPESDGCLSDVGSVMSDSQLSSVAGIATATMSEESEVLQHPPNEPPNSTKPNVHLVTRYLGRRSKTVPLRALKRRYLGPPKSFPCKRPAIEHSSSTASVSSASESMEDEKPVIENDICAIIKEESAISVQMTESKMAVKTNRKKKNKRCRIIPVPDDFLTTDMEYFLPDYHSESDTLDCSRTIEVPSWRYKHVSSYYQMEGTEVSVKLFEKNIDDRVFHRRHQKCEQDEKRRKRWDIQRLREQKAAEKLKYKKQSETKNGSDDHKQLSLYPDPSRIEAIEVTDRLPVTAFGAPIPLFQPSEFNLPFKIEPDAKDALSSGSSGNRVT